MKCVLHIGTEKTGSTLLQDWLYQNRKQLSKQRLYLSNILGKNNNRRLVSYFQRELDDWTSRNKISSQQEKKYYFDGFTNDFVNEIVKASRDHDVFLVTSEHFHSRLKDKEEIKALQQFLQHEFDSVKVVCYFREQMQMASSLYSTAVKGPYTTTLDDYFDRVTPSNYYYNYKEIADNWSGSFGRQNCEFRIYDKARFVEQDLRKDLLSCLDMQFDFDLFDYTIESSNESLSQLESQLYRATNELIPYWEDENGNASRENINVKSRISSIECIKHGRVESAHMVAGMRMFSESNKLFFNEYFDGKYLFPIAPVDYKDEKKQISFTIDQVAEIVGELFKEFLLDVKSSKHLLTDSDVDCLRDLALGYEKSIKLTLNDAFKLMEIAGKARPEGPLIKKKLSEYKARLT